MIADDRVTPIVMDFGSTVKARINIENRSQALLQQVKCPITSAPLLLTRTTGHCCRAKYNGLSGP
jgi:hypothetical protein